MKPTTPRFYLPIDYAPGPLTLPESVAHHAVRVCRMRVGDRLTLFNGNDCEAVAVLTKAEKPCLVEVEEIEAVCRESPLDVTLIQALPAMDRMDTIVQKSVELGVTRIYPVITRRSVRIDSDRAANKTRHWQRLAVAACEQSGRTRIPTVHPPGPLVTRLTSPTWPHGATRWLLAPEATRSLATETINRASPQGLCLLVGSEGGFEPGEIESIVKADFQPVRLGPRVLRTETAGPVAIAVCQTAYGDFR